MRAKEKGKGRSLLRNLRFCLASTRQCAPLLLPLCALSAACSASTALLNTFLPRAAIDAILRGNARTLLLCVPSSTIAPFSSKRIRSQKRVEARRWEMKIALRPRVRSLYFS